MIIEMKSTMVFQSFGLDNVYKKPSFASEQAHMSIGYLGGNCIDVYLHQWDEFVEKVHEADKVMQEAKSFYELRINERDDRAEQEHNEEIAYMGRND
jgi:hypothetical protein